MALGLALVGYGLLIMQVKVLYFRVRTYWYLWSAGHGPGTYFRAGWRIDVVDGVLLALACWLVWTYTLS